MTDRKLSRGPSGRTQSEKLWGAFFLACFSDNYGKRSRSYMKEELALAIKLLSGSLTHKNWLIPVRFSECRIPDLPIGDGEKLSAIQWVDLFPDWRAGVHRLWELMVLSIPHDAYVLLGYAYHKLFRRNETSFSTGDILRDWNGRDKKIFDDKEYLLDEVDFMLTKLPLEYVDEGVRVLDLNKLNVLLDYVVVRGWFIRKRKRSRSGLSELYSLTDAGRMEYSRRREFTERSVFQMPNDAPRAS